MVNRFTSSCWSRLLLAAGLACAWVVAMPGGRADEPTSAKAKTKSEVVPLDPTQTWSFRDEIYVPGSKYPAQKLDLDLPKRENGPVPLVIWIHGGGWRSGDKGGDHPAKGLLNKGFAVASINYRLTGSWAWPAQLQDCLAAVKYLRSNAKRLGIDPNRIGVWGSSAGGHLAAMLGVLSDQRSGSPVQAVCDWFGPADLVNAMRDVVPESKTATVDMLYGLVLGPNGQNKKARDAAPKALRVKVLADASPIQHVTGKEPPFLIMHGTADKVVAHAQSQRFFSVLKAKRVDVTFRSVPGAGHGPAEFLQFIPQVEAFFERTLKRSDQKPGSTANAPKPGSPKP